MGGDPMEDYEERKRKWYLDVRSTPCARSALIFGILGGTAVGLLWFTRTGVVRRSCDFAVGGFAVTSLLTWEACRYQKAKLRAELKNTIHVLDSLNAQAQNLNTPSPDLVASNKTPPSS